jgi:L-asparaginase
MKKKNILLVYTGGTIGMVQDSKTGALIPFDFSHLYAQVPELERFDFSIQTHGFKTPMDSSNMDPVFWVELANIIHQGYERFDGFVILHGTDTMAFTASALSFMLEGLAKPVILTGSQLPIGSIRTDGKENLITAIEIAASDDENGNPMVPEVALYFEYRLFRGNRTHKFSSEHFDAFISPNYPALAEVGIHIGFNRDEVRNQEAGSLLLHTGFEQNIAILKLFPGITPSLVSSMLTNPSLKGLIIESFGSGNGPSYPWFHDLIKEAIARGILILNISQCSRGSVSQGRYETSEAFLSAGVIGGADMTFEAAVCKMMFVLGMDLPIEGKKALLSKSLRGELTEP